MFTTKLGQSPNVGGQSEKVHYLLNLELYVLL